MILILEQFTQHLLAGVKRGGTGLATSLVFDISNILSYFSFSFQLWNKANSQKI
jgi:hypothetical protein